MKKFYGVSRSRDRGGQIVKTSFIDYTMCLTSFAAMGHPTMWVLVAEVYDEDEYEDETIQAESERGPEGEDI